MPERPTLGGMTPTGADGSPRGAPGAPGAPDHPTGPAAPGAQGLGRYAALRSGSFARLWVGLLVSNAGVQMEYVAKSWLVLEGTDSPGALGLLSLCFAVPITVLPPLGGLLADRVDRISLLRATQVALTVQPLVTAGLLAAGWAPLWLLYVHTAVATALLALDQPARQALLPALVRREALLSATGLLSVVYTGAQLVGPALGGVLLPHLGAAWLFALNGLSSLAVLAALFGLRGVDGRPPRAPGDRPHGAEGVLTLLGGGLRFASASPPVMALLGLTLAVNLLGSAQQTLLPVLARDGWGVGAGGYGLLAAAGGAGALVAGLALAAAGDLPRKALLAGGAGLGFGLALMLAAVVPPFALGLVAMTLAGAARAVSGAATATLLQLTTPDALRGRVMALHTVALVGLSSFGGAAAGAVAQGAGAPATVAWGAGALILVTPALACIARRAAAR
jgi:hypothetical protein